MNQMCLLLIDELDRYSFIMLISTEVPKVNALGASNILNVSFQSTVGAIHGNANDDRKRGESTCLNQFKVDFIFL